MTNGKQILNAVEKAKKVKGQPVMIICHTVKGKGFAPADLEGKVEKLNAALTASEKRFYDIIKRVCLRKINII